MSFELHNGDCLEIMRKMDEGSVDAVVTDPPYGLSNQRGASLEYSILDIFFDVVFPDLYDVYAKAFAEVDFLPPFRSIAFLDFMNGAIWEKPGIAMPECSVNLNSNTEIRDKEIKDSSKLAAGISNSVLRNKVNTQCSHLNFNYFLNIRPSIEFAIGNRPRCGFRQLSPGCFRVPIVISRDSCFSRFLCALDPGGSPFLSDVVGFCNGSKGQALAPSIIVTSSGAEMVAMLDVDLTRGLINLSSAVGAGEFDFLFELTPSKLIGAGTAASGLSSKFKSCGISRVNGATDGAFSLYVHKDVLSQINKNRNGFMNRTWDKDVPAAEVWSEALRVAKPGAMLMAFGGTRKWHRLAVEIEDAGWEIRDTIMWVYGSGFPKSANISKLIDSELGQEVVASPEARQWNGYGTALKPSWEPIIMAMKPIDGTYAKNALTHGVAGVNIEACRVPIEDGARMARNNRAGGNGWKNSSGGANSAALYGEPSGRWPTNFAHDGSAEVLEGFPEASGGGSVRKESPSNSTKNSYGHYEMRSLVSHNDQGSAARFFYCAKASPYDRDLGLSGNCQKKATNDGRKAYIDNAFQRGDTQRRNNHPAVKPVELMRWLVRMVSMPMGSVILDPFMGSGSTGVACLLEGQKFVGIERDDVFFELAKERVSGTESIANLEWKVVSDTPSSYEDMPLFSMG